MPQICEKDWQTVQEFRTNGILVDLDKEKLQSMNTGVIVLGCGDANRDPEDTDYLMRLLPNHAKMPKVHSIKRNGGAMLLAPASPLVPLGRTAHLDLLDDIYDAHVELGIMNMIAKAHIKCLKCFQKNLFANHVVLGLIAAKKVIKTRCPDLSVTLCLDVDGGEFNNNRKQTFKVSRTALQGCSHLPTVVDLLQEQYPDRVTVTHRH